MQYFFFTIAKKKYIFFFQYKACQSKQHYISSWIGSIVLMAILTTTQDHTNSCYQHLEEIRIRQISGNVHSNAMHTIKEMVDLSRDNIFIV